MFGVAFIRIEDEKFLFQMGGISWGAAYFSVLIDNLIRKTPIQTWKGVVRYEDKPIRYILPFVFLFVWGALALTIIALSMIAP